MEEADPFGDMERRLHPEGAPGELDAMMRRLLGDTVFEQVKRTNETTMMVTTIAQGIELRRLSARVWVMRSLAASIALLGCCAVALTCFVIAR